MLMVLSPAKNLSFEGAPQAPLTTPELKADIAELDFTTRKLRKADLKWDKTIKSGKVKIQT